MPSSSTSIYTTNGAGSAMARADATRSKSSVSTVNGITRISYTVAGAWSSTTNPPDVPQSTGLIHGRVQT